MGLRPGKTKGPYVGIPSGIGQETGKIKISNNDTTLDYIENKIIAGNNISITKQNIGNNENLLISLTGAFTTWIHDIRPDEVDIENGASITDIVTTTHSRRRRVVLMPEGSNCHFDIPMHPNYGGGSVKLLVHWTVNDESHGTVHACRYHANFIRNNDNMDIAAVNRDITLQADQNDFIRYIDEFVLTIEGTYNVRSGLYLTFFHLSTCAASGDIQILSFQIRYNINL